jgi:septum formation protein
LAKDEMAEATTAEGPARALILASASATRAELLRRAGLVFEVEVSPVDEAEMKRSLRTERAPARDAALTLARLKAERVSARHPAAFVVGADQLLVCEGEWFDKPPDMRAARAQLLSLRGREHELVTAVCVACDGAPIWHHLEAPRLAMRAFSDAFLEAYLERLGPTVCEVVGAYRLEDIGAQLFERVEGDWFAILGLPVMPLLAFLREHGLVER